MYWVLYVVAYLIQCYNFQLNSITLLKQSVANDRQINCYKVVLTRISENIGASAISCITSKS